MTTEKKLHLIKIVKHLTHLPWVKEHYPIGSFSIEDRSLDRIEWFKFEIIKTWKVPRNLNVYGKGTIEEVIQDIKDMIMRAERSFSGVRRNNKIRGEIVKDLKVLK